MEIKVCGMKYSNNIRDIGQLEVDYLGFIFYEKSARHFEGEIPTIPLSIQKIGVFVDASISMVIAKVKKYDLAGIQLHGEESPSYIQELRRELPSTITILKAFGMSNSFDFSNLIPYKDIVDYFLFDTKGHKRGGNGVVFDWKILENYSLDKPYFLSGGIGLDTVGELKTFLKTELATLCIAIDINSRFEESPALKRVHDVKTFIQQIKN